MLKPVIPVPAPANVKECEGDEVLVTPGNSLNSSVTAPVTEIDLSLSNGKVPRNRLMKLYVNDGITIVVSLFFCDNRESINAAGLENPPPSLTHLNDECKSKRLPDVIISSTKITLYSFSTVLISFLPGYCSHQLTV